MPLALTPVVVRPGPVIESHLLGIESLLPTQLGTRTPPTGARELIARLLVEALTDAGVLGSGCWRSRGTPTRRELARRWLLGEFDAEVPVPFTWCCEVLGIDAATLARIVRQRVP